MRRIGPALVALTALGAPAAWASPIALPVNRFVVDLPSSWTIYRALGASNLDLLHSTTGGSLAIGWTDVDCAAFFDLQATALGTTLDTPTLSYLPSGWEARSWSGGILGCHKLAATTLAAEWWPLPEAEYNDQSAWQGEITSALGALDSMHQDDGATARGDLVQLPGTGLAVQVPEAFRVALADPSASKDVLDLGPAGTVEISRISTACTEAASGSTVSDAAVAGWKHWSSGSADAFCIEASSNYLVTAPVGEPSTPALLESIAGEINSPAVDSVARLPGSRWKLAPPTGWTALATTGADVLSGGGGHVTIRHPASCEAALGTRAAYAPTWLPSDWKAVLDADGASVILCTTIELGSIEVDASPEIVVGRQRHLLAGLLDSVRTESAETDPIIPRSPLLPVPLELSMQTIDGTERGWGARGALTLWRLAGFAQLRGELGYDSVTGLSFDARGTLGFPLGDASTFYGVFGGDKTGSGSHNVLAGDVYYGMGYRVGVYDHDDGKGWLLFSAEYLWRNQPSPPAMMPLDLDLHPDHEWRFRGEIYVAATHLIQGVSIEYRAIATSNIFLVGLFTRL